MHNKLVTHLSSLIPNGLREDGRPAGNQPGEAVGVDSMGGSPVRVLEIIPGKNELVFSVKVKGKIHDSGPRRRPGIQLVDHRTTP